MQSAINAFKEGASQRAAAIKCNVSRTTLNDKILGNTAEERKIGKEPVLSSEESVISKISSTYHRKSNMIENWFHFM